MWDTRIITYHHVPQPTSTTAHFSDTNLLVALSLFGGSTQLSVILIQPLGRPFRDLTTKPQLIWSHTQWATPD